MFAYAISRVEGASADGVHLIWAGPRAWGYSREGYLVMRRRAIRIDPRRCVTIDGARLAQLHAEHVLPFELGTARFRRGACPKPFAKLLSDPVPKPRRGGYEQRAGAAVTSAAPHGRRAAALRAIANPGCSIYRIDLATPQPRVRVRVQTGAMLVVALRDEKVVAAHEITTLSPPCDAVLSAPAIDRIVIYCRSATAITLCVLDDGDVKKLDSKWSDSDVIAKLQLPVRELDGSLSSSADELAIAQSRMLDPSLLDGTELDTLALTIRRLVGMKDRCPSTLTWMRRETLDIDLQDYGLLEVALVPAIEADMRRAFGLAHRDNKGLVAGEAYDYRIVGRFPEIDLRDRLLTFARVPYGTVIPSAFSLGDVHVRLPASTSVELSPTVQADTLDLVGRRGITLSPGQPVVLSLASPVRELSLELEPIAGHDLAFRASAGVWSGIVGGTFIGSVPPRARARLDFPDPIDRLELSGRAFLHGVRLHGIIGPARDEARIVASVVDIPAVVYAPTTPPPPPLELAVANLQRPIVRAAPGAETADAPHSLGFRLTWRPAAAAPLTGWPDELGAPPPLESAGFRVERRRVDVASEWEPIGGQVVYGQRYGRSEPPVVAPDVDLIALFEDGIGGDNAVDTLTLDDPLWQPGDETGPEPSSQWQYRIAAVDMTGRFSATWTTSPVVMLEKHRPPPPPAPPLDLGDTEPRGVRARLIQRGVPGLSAADLALLGTRDSVLRLDWAWTAAERAADPHANEFRLYLRRGAFDVVRAEVRGPITPDATRWRFNLVLDRDVGIDELAGARLQAGKLIFKLVAHAAGVAGTELDARVQRRHVIPVKPALGPALLRLPTRGDETRPTSYEERSAIVPLEPGVDDYSFEWTDVVSVSAEDKRGTYWIGVSCADNQWYVDDALPASEPNGGRPGNESQIVARGLVGRYVGSPSLDVPPPLDDIPERVTNEPQANVQVALPLPLLVRPSPPIVLGAPVQLERIAASDVTTRLAEATTGGFRVRHPDGSEAAYSPLNPADVVTLAAELATGEPARVAGRFIYDVVRRVAGLDELWHQTGGLVPFGDVVDTVGGAAERWIYRLRIADAAGRLSANAIMLDELVRVPSLRTPTRPELDPARSNDDAVRASCRVRWAFDIRWVLFFVEPLPPGAQPPREPEVAPQLIRIPNRRDLYPSDGVRLRTKSGELLAPIVVAVAAQTPDTLGLVTAELAHVVGFDRIARVWCASMTRDGIPSSAAGPRWCTSGPAPVVVPTPAATRTGNRIEVTWTAAASVHEVRVERQQANGDWIATTMWLPDDLETAAFTVAPGPIVIRLVARSRDGRTATGTSLTVGP
jgi:hypothetical protein